MVATRKNTRPPLAAPCKSVLKYHMLQALFQAKLWQFRPTLWIEASEITDFSWDIEGKPIRVAEFFPGDVTDIFLNKPDDILPNRCD